MLKIGDKVRIRTEIDKIDDVNHLDFNPVMLDLEGNITTVAAVEHDGVRLEIDNGRFKWGEYWLESLSPVKITPVKLPKDVNNLTILGQNKAKKHLKVAVAENIPVLLIGDTGTGKTTIVKELAEKQGTTSIRFNLTGETTIDEFLGKYTLDNGVTKWSDGVLLQAMKNGHWLIVDEVNVALPEILFVLHSLLDDERAVMVANHNGEVVKPHKDFRFFATMNPVEEYAGTKDLNKAFKSRFGMILNLEYPSPRFESAILQAKASIDAELANKLVDMATRIRKAKKSGAIFYTCSTRDLLQVAKLVEPLGLSDAIKVTIVNKANGDVKDITQIIKELNIEYAETESHLDTLNLDVIQDKINAFKTIEQDIKAKQKDFDAKEKELSKSLKALELKESKLVDSLKDKEKHFKAVIRKQLIQELAK